eukprot:Gb_17729 [translate_table: standard]
MASRVIPKNNGLKSFLPSLKKWFASRQMSTAAARNYAPEENDRMEIDNISRQAPPSRRTDLNSLLNDAWSPFFPLRSLRQAMDTGNLFNLFIDDPLFRSPLSGPSTRSRGGQRTPWDVREDDDAFRLRVDMPGLGKQDVKVQVEDNMLIIKGEAKGEGDAEDIKYSTRVELPEDFYKADKVKAEMKNGVLKVTVPKVAKEEMKKVVDVKVE